MKVYVFITSLFFAGILQAQYKSYLGIRSGVYLKSATIRHTIFTYNANIKSSIGNSVGLYGKFLNTNPNVSFHSGFQIGLNYVNKGWTQSFKKTTQPLLTDYSVVLNYLQIPMEGFGYFGRENKYMVGIGFFVDFLTGYKKDRNPEITSEFIDFSTYEPERDRRVGYGIKIFLGVFRDFSFGQIHLDAFYSYSVGNVIDAGDLSNDKLPDITNLTSIGLTFGYFIPMQKKQP